jgi:hypothetical protein
LNDFIHWWSDSKIPISLTVSVIKGHKTKLFLIKWSTLVVPFEYWTGFRSVRFSDFLIPTKKGHSKSGLVQYLDVHCIIYS